MSVEWHPYPFSKPPAQGWYLVSMISSSSGRLTVRSRYYDFDTQCFYYDRAGDSRVKAWAELPEPFAGKTPFERSAVPKRR